jgi:hypothetical protein
MNRFLVTITFLGALMMVFSAYSSSRKAQSPTLGAVSAVVPDTFVLPEIPASLTTPAERAEYLVINYWNRFDFTNEALIERPEITEQAFVDYINILNFVSQEIAKKSLSNTLRKAQENRQMYLHFVSLFEKYFYGIDSPFRNEPFYIFVLREVLASCFLSEIEKLPFQFQLEMALKNNVGSRAANFNYTLASGEIGNLHALQSEYTLLIFSDPACDVCAAIIRQLDGCERINATLAMNVPERAMLTVLTIYPHGNRDEWLAHLPSKPTNWIHGHDNGQEIARGRLYNIRAFPTIYLLDRDKNVILQNTTPEEVESFFSKP